MRKSNLRPAALVLLVSASLLAAPGCKKGGESGPAGKKPGAKLVVSYPVEVQPVAVQSLIFTVNAVGSVDAFEKVQVTARVGGIVDRVVFAEGSRAELNQVLVEIEPERYRLAVESAQASYDKSVASKADADAGLKRREQVITQNPGLIPGEEVETWRTKVRLAAADVAQTQSALNQANLNLRDAYVRAPFAGIVQTRTVQTGQYVQVGTVLATLIRRDPLLLRFKVPERDAAQLRPGMTANFKVRDNDKEYAANIVHVAAAADEASRMVDVTGRDPRLGRPGPAARRLRRDHHPGQRAANGPGHPPDRHPAERARLHRLRRRGRIGPRAHPDHRDADDRRAGRGPDRAQARRDPRRPRRRGPPRGRAGADRRVHRLPDREPAGGARRQEESGTSSSAGPRRQGRPGNEQARREALT